MLYDWHTHLNDDKLYDIWPEILNNFIAQWWKWLVNQWVSEMRNQRAIDIAEKCKNSEIYVKATIWFHPSEAVEKYITLGNLSQKIISLEEIYKKNSEYIVAIWECGLDYHYEWSMETKDIQKKLFEEQCKLADKLNLPLVVHSRDAFQDTMDVLKDFKTMKIYFHCRGYWPDELMQVVNMLPNSFVWFAWNVTYPKAVNLKESLLICPQDKLILETDAPYLAPQGMRGQINEPALVKHIYEFAAQNLWMDIEYLQNLVEENFRKLYNI